MREIAPQYENHRDEWREEENERRYEREQSRRRIVTDPRDPDFIAPEEEEDDAYPTH